MGRVHWLRWLWVSPSGVPRPWAGLWFAIRRRWWRLRFGWFIPRWVAFRVKGRVRWAALPAWVRGLLLWLGSLVGQLLVGLLLLKGALWLVPHILPFLSRLGW